MDREATFAAILEAIADGTPIDWPAIAAGRDPAALLRLKRVEQVVRLHREVSAWLTSNTARSVEPQPTNVSPDRPAVDQPANRPRFTRGDVWGRLLIEDVLGVGGQGVVYRALDRALDRRVALKVLTGPVNRSEATDEGRMLARIYHPHVVTVYGAERVAGQVGLWMQLVTGRTLQEIVSDSGPLGAREAAVIGLDLCNALAAIHAAGLLHRDIKAQNVMRESGGRIVLMDLGVGRLLDDAPSSGDLSGTPLYLAPELFERRPASAQSDIYSLGVLLFYLVTQKLPMMAQAFEDLRERHRRGIRTALRDTRADLPIGFVRVVDRALSPSPTERYATAGEMERALASFVSPYVVPTDNAGFVPSHQTARSRPLIWLFAFTTIAAVATLTMGLTLKRESTTAVPAPFEQRASILVAAFENRTGEPALDGVVEFALDRELADSELVNVVSFARVQDSLKLMRLPATTTLDAVTAREVAVRDGSVRALITGRIERVGRRYSISANVLEASSGRSLGGAVQSVLDAGSVLNAVSRLTGDLRILFGEARHFVRADQLRLERVTTTSLEALQLYSKAVNAAGRGQWQSSLELTRQALDQDPAFASAVAWLGICYRSLGQRDAAIAELARALPLAAGMSDRERLFIQASYYDAAGKQDEAIGAYQALVDRYPDDFWAVSNLGPLLAASAGAANVVPLYTRAATLNPNSFRANQTAAYMLVTTLGDLERAKPFIAQALRVQADDAVTPWGPWLSLVPVFERWADGDAAAATALLDDLLQTHGARDEYLWQIGSFRLALGQLSAAEETFARLRKPHTEPLIALLRGDLDESRRQFRERSGNPFLLGYLVRLGLIDQARKSHEMVSTGAPGSPGAAVTAGEMALAEGKLDEAARQFQHAVAGIPSGGTPALLAARSYASVLARQGRAGQAARILEDATTNVVRSYHNVGNPLLEWIQTRAQLAELLRDLDRNKEADAIEAALARMLARADGDFQIGAHLKRN